MSNFLRLMAVSILVVMVGCAQSVRTRINSFQAATPIDTSSSVAVVPSDSGQAQSLEFALYKSQLEQELVRKGFTLTSREQAHLHAILSYSVNRVMANSDTGVRTGVMLGSQRGAFGSNVMILDGSPKSAWYERKLGFVLERNNKERVRLYEINAQSEGACGVLSAVVPDMLTALFKQFPMANGAIKTISVPVSQKCQ